MTFRRALALCAVTGVLCLLVSLVSADKPLRGFKGVELGMPWEAVMKVLKAGGSGEGLLRSARCLSWHVPNHRVFRHAEFRFDDHGFLSEIVLTMREIIDKKKVVQELRKSYDLDMAEETTVVRDGVALKVVGNKLFMRDAQVAVAGTGQGQRLSGQPPQR